MLARVGRSNLKSAGEPIFTALIADQLCLSSEEYSVSSAGSLQPLGMALYYLIGPLLGASFGVAVHTVRAFRLTSLGKAVWLSVLYVEAVSVPMLMAAAITLELTASAAAQWFGISFVLHLVYGLVLGLAVGFAGRFSRA